MTTQKPDNKPIAPALTRRPGIERETDLLNLAVKLGEQAATGMLGGTTTAKEANALLRAGQQHLKTAKQRISNRLTQSRRARVVK
jgi:hypothetical protein